MICYGCYWMKIWKYNLRKSIIWECNVNESNFELESVWVFCKCCFVFVICFIFCGVNGEMGVLFLIRWEYCIDFDCW